MEVQYPKISVITPSFNQGQFLEETLLSVINQNYQNLEYIVIDGGSTDGSVEIIEKYGHYLAYWVSENDSGQSEAINKGFKRATGEIVCWINSDDILMPGSLNEVARYFENHKNVDIVSGILVNIDKNSIIYSSFFTIKHKKWYAKHGVYYMNQPTLFWKREIFDTTGLLREDFHFRMDRELLIRFFQNNFKFGFIRKILAGFRMHERSKSSEGESSKILKRDRSVIYELHGEKYGRKSPKMFYRLIYGMEKLTKGIYFEKWAFERKWIGKKVDRLNPNNCNYM